jgi:hypothetical protein
MAARWGLGPVFAAEYLTSCRRWQVYAGRSLLVACVLAGVALTWLKYFSGREFTSLQDLAAAGSSCVRAIMAVELVLALVVVPAATAGAICQDKMQGGLTLMMVTDLSDAEIVLGKLASRLVTVLGVVACGLPVLAILTSLGGVDPVETLSGSMVIVGVAVLSVSLPLTFSVWATKPHEALMATYAAYAIWLLALPVWVTTIGTSVPPDLFCFTNPFWLLFEGGWFSPSSWQLLRLGFLVGALVLSTVLAAVSTWRIRAVTLRHAGRPARKRVARPATGWSWIGRCSMPTVSLDADPVLWREVHRRQPSGWARAIWGLYGVLSVLFTVLGLFARDDIAPGISAFMVSFGLLMVSVTSATALAEERSLGSLDLLLATPLSTRAIVLGKWWGAFHAVRWLAVLPGVLAFGAALRHRGFLTAMIFAAATAALVVAYGAVVTSLGIALAAWQPRLGRAVGFSVAAFLTATVILPAIGIMTVSPVRELEIFLGVSPFFGMLLPMSWATLSPQGARSHMFWWIALTTALALGVRRATVASFDEFMGRVPDSF